MSFSDGFEKEKLSEKKIEQLIEEIAHQVLKTAQTSEINDLQTLIIRLTVEKIKGSISSDPVVQDRMRKVVEKLTIIVWERNQQEFQKFLDAIEDKLPNDTEYIDYSTLPDITSNPALHLDYMKEYEFEEDKELRKYVSMQVNDFEIEQKTLKEMEVKSKIEQIRKKAKLLILEKQKILKEFEAASPFYMHEISVRQLPEHELFEVLHKQITSLKCIELLNDPEQLIMQYGGFLYPSKIAYMFEIVIENKNLTFKLFSNDPQNFSRFKSSVTQSKLTNIINFSIDYLEKTKISTNLIYINIKNAFNLIDELFKLFDLTKQDSVEKLYLKIGDVKVLFEGKLKLLKLGEIFENLRIKLAKHLEKETMGKNLRAEVQYIILNWIQESLFFAEANIRNYIDTVSIEDVAIKVKEDLENTQRQFDAHIQSYEKEILQYLLIMGKYNSVSYYSHGFKESEILPNLMSGFLSAIQSFGLEIMRTSSIRKMQYEDSNIYLFYGEDIITALVTSGQIMGPLYQKMESITKEFEKTFKEELIEFVGKIDVFKPARKLIPKYFPT